MSEAVANVEGYDPDAERHARIDEQLYDREFYAAEQARRHLRDFVPFVWSIIEPSREYNDNWSTHALCEHLEAVYDGQIRDLLLLIPPRCMKSITTSVAFPAWCWIHDPSLRFLFSSYAQSLSSRDSRKCRDVIDSPLYARHFRCGPQPEAWEMRDDQNEKMRYENTATGLRIATSVDGAATGEGADVLVCDDAHNVMHVEREVDRKKAVDWWHGTMSTRLNDPKTGARIIIMHRSHENDLAGVVMDRMALEEDYPNYEVLMLPHEYDPKRHCSTSIGFEDPRTTPGELLWPDRFGHDELGKLRAELGPRGAAAQLQQEPTPSGGDLLRREWFTVVDSAPSPELWLEEVRAWDLAATEEAGDWTASGRVVRAQDGYWYVLHISQFQKGPGRVEEAIKSQASQDGRGTTVGIEQEPGASGKLTVANFAREVLPNYTVIGCPTASKSKWERARTLASKAELGLVRLVRGSWNEEFLHAAETFGPGGAKLDVMDATVHAFNATLEDDRDGDGFMGVIA